MGVVAVSVSAQEVDEAEAVIERYERVTGLDRLSTVDMTSVMMEVVAERQGVSVPMKMVLKEPDKIRVEMEIDGREMRMAIDGKSGWISVPGQGTMPMPDEVLEQLAEQTRIGRNYRWNKRDFAYRMVGKVMEAGRTCVGVRMIPHKPQPQIGERVVYFDEATGLAAYMTMQVDANGQAKSFRMDFSDYKTFGELKLPSVYRATTDGGQDMVMKVKTLEYDYPVADALFSEPE